VEEGDDGMNTEQFDGHTPGPWWIDEVSDNGHKDTWLMGNFPQDDMLLCMEFAESNEADVRLIAAAPDLLAEVKRLREELFDTHAFYSVMEQKLAFAVGIKQGLLTSMSMDDLVDSMNRDYHDRLNEHMNGRLRK
jgi:hypothetical protein